MARKIIKVGVMSYAGIKARTIAIARGSMKPGKGAPKIWFPSVKSFASVLSEKNTALLAVIKANKPESLAELEKITGRAQGNLSRTLRTMEKYGIVRLVLVEGKGRRGRAPVKPIVLADEIRLDLELVPRAGELVDMRRGQPIARPLPLRSKRRMSSHADLRAGMPRLKKGSEKLVRAERDER